MTLVPRTNLAELVAAKQIGLSALLDMLAAESAVQVTSPPKNPQGKIAISDEQRTTLRRLANLLADLDLPETARELTEPEKAVFVPLFDQIKTGRKALDGAEDSLKLTFANSLDAEAKRLAGPEDTLEYDKNGHVLKEGSVFAKGQAKKVSRELRGGGAEGLTVKDLEKLLAGGGITQEQFDDWTEQETVTSLVEDRIMASVAADPGLIAVLATVVETIPKTASIYVRANK